MKIKNCFIKYNKIIYALYSFMIMLLFNTYSTISYCEENIIEEKIKEFSLNNYVYYTLIALGSITLVYTTFLLSAYYFPDVDVLNLFHDKDLAAYPNYSLNSLFYEEVIDKQIITHYFSDNGHEILIDKNLFERFVCEINTQKITVDNLNTELLIKQQQLENFNKLLDLMSPTLSSNHQPIRRNTI